MFGHVCELILYAYFSHLRCWCGKHKCFGECEDVSSWLTFVKKYYIYNNHKSGLNVFKQRFPIVAYKLCGMR